MEKIKHCIRCGKEFHNEKRLTNNEIHAIKIVCHTDLLKVDYENIVCSHCRAFIGDEVSDKLLGIFNST